MLRLICAFVLVLSIASPTLGQQSLVGTYKMVSNVLNIDGTLTENMGKAPKGYLVLTPTRIVFFFTAENRKFGTSVDEKAALFDTLTAWSGVYRIEGKKLIIRVDASWVEHWNGKDQIRNWELSDNRLTITADPFPFPRDPSKKVIPQQVWEKVE
jgi:Lipocalin-like domain